MLLAGMRVVILVKDIRVGVMFIKRFLHITSTLQIIFCTSTISSLFIIFLFKQFYKIQTLDFSGIELGSLEKRVSMLTTWPAPPRPSCPLFQLGKIFYHVSQLFFSRSLFKNWPTPAPFRLIFCLFNQTIQFLQQNIVKNVNPVSGTRIWTHNLLIMSLLPLPLDQGSAPLSLSFFRSWNGNDKGCNYLSESRCGSVWPDD